MHRAETDHITLKRASLVGLLLLLTACGFQLRGAAPVSSALQPLAVVCTSQIPETLCTAVQDQLRLGEVNLTTPEQAAYLLKLSTFKETRRASAITLRAAAAEYNIRQTVGIEVLTQDQIPLVALSQVQSSESYRYDEANVLAKQREERVLQQTLHQRLAQQIIFRLVPLTKERIEVIKKQSEVVRKRGTTTDSGLSTEQ